MTGVQTCALPICLIQADVDPEAYVLTVIVLVLATVSATGVAEAVLGDASGDAVRAARERQQAELLRLTKAALFKPKKDSATSASKETT